MIRLEELLAEIIITSLNNSLRRINEISAVT
jgi:hypothetical protein